MLRVPLLIVFGVVAYVRVAAADPCDSSALRAALEAESRYADRWALAWQLVYTVGAVTQIGLAAADVGDFDANQSLWVGGVKSSIAAVGHWLAPMRIKVPQPTGDACADHAALREAIARAADVERDAFWSAQLGGLVINLGGTLYLVEKTGEWRAALLSFGTGYAFGLIGALTMPRASWGRVHERSWALAANVVITPEHYALVIGGSF